MVLYNIPGRTAVNMPPDLLAELAQIDGIEAVKQANSRRAAARSTASRSSPATTTSTARCLDIGGAGGICVASHVVGPEMRRMYDEPEARAEIDASLQDVYDGDVHHRQPDAGQGRAERCSATTPARCGCRWSSATRRSARRSTTCSRATGCSRGVTAAVSGTLRVLPLGGVGEIGKNMTVVEYDGRIVVVDCGLRFPTAEMMGIDLVLPDFTYLREQRRRDRGDRHHARPRGPPRARCRG